MKIKDYGILLVGFLFRILKLDEKPPHFDEGIMGWFADQISVAGYYKYDPQNYHGPFHYYLTYATQFIFGHNLLGLRISSVVLGVGVLVVILKSKDLLGENVARLTALLLALAPGYVFFSRMSSLEVDFLFFTILFVTAFLKNRAWSWALAFAGMLVTKETWAISVLALVPAAIASGLPQKLHLRWRPIFIAVLVVAILYSGFFKNPTGLLDFFKAYLPWAKTGIEGGGHHKPISYWLTLFLKYEVPAGIGMLYGIRYLFSKSNPVLSFFAVFGWVQLIIYSWIPYKTPWCILAIAWPFYILFSAGVEDLCLKIKNLNWRRGAMAVLACGILVYGALSYRLSFVHFVSESEPYVYVQTKPEVMEVMADLRAAAAEDPLNFDSHGYVFMSSQWPMPWLLHDFKRLNYYTQLPQIPLTHPEIIFADANLRDALGKKIAGTFYLRTFDLRPAMEKVDVYFSEKIFKNHIQETKVEKYQKIILGGSES